jgi:hypothetical protein
VKLIPCPACPAQLQHLEPSTSYAQKAWDYAQAHHVQVPPHGPAALTLLSLTAHAQTVHPDLDLVQFLEAYLDS